jgi:hypothetical protein
LGLRIVFIQVVCGTGACFVTSCFAVNCKLVTKLVIKLFTRELVVIVNIYIRVYCISFPLILLYPGTHTSFTREWWQSQTNLEFIWKLSWDLRAAWLHKMLLGIFDLCEHPCKEGQTFRISFGKVCVLCQGTHHLNSFNPSNST